MSQITSDMALYCPACQRLYDPRDRLFGCPGADTGAHILTKQWADTFDRQKAETSIRRNWADGVTDSFALFHHLSATSHMLGAGRYLQLLNTLQDRLRSSEGIPFQVTPLVQTPALAGAAGLKRGLWVKDETGNITGSHKGRHLMGSLLYLEGLRALNQKTARQVLAIYSCGNAALAASAVARAGGYELHAFVPDTVEKTVAQMLTDRGAVVEMIPRGASDGGDPCYLAFRRAIEEKKWVPFSCSGNDNWSNIDGGETLGAEMAMQLRADGAEVSCLVIQVGGGALARAISQAWAALERLEISPHLPRIYVCQAAGSYPFVRAYYLALAAIARYNTLDFNWDYERSGTPAAELERMRCFAEASPHQITALADFTRRHFEKDAVQSPLKEILRHSEQFMWPWDGPLPAGLAHGILDDLTYDWYYLLRSILKSGGQAVIVEEEKFQTAHRLAHEHTKINVSPTGCAGLAGLLKLIDTGTIAPTENVGLFFTGIDR